MKAWSYLEIIDLRPHSRHGLLTKDNSSEGGGKGETGLTPHDEVYTVLEDFVIPMSCLKFNQVAPHQRLLQIAEKTARDKRS